MIKFLGVIDVVSGCSICLICCMGMVSMIVCWEFSFLRDLVKMILGGGVVFVGMLGLKMRRLKLCCRCVYMK